MNCAISTSVSGPVSSEATSTISAVRRSRSASRSSLQEHGDDAARLTARPPRPPGARTRPRGSRSRSRRAAASRVPRATTRPARHDHDLVAERRDFLHHVAREEHALAGVAQAPDHVAQAARGHHVEPVGGLVEDHVGRVVHERARDRDLHALALREAVGAPVEERRRGRAAARGARCDGVERRAGEAAQLAVVGDVLARGEPRVEAARVRQHADARAHGERVAAARRGRRPAPCPAWAPRACEIMRSVVVLPAPLGPSRPVMRAVRRGERDAAHGLHVAEALGERASATITGRRPSGQHEERARDALEALAVERRARCPGARTPRSGAARSRARSRRGRGWARRAARALGSVARHLLAVARRRRRIDPAREQQHGHVGAHRVVEVGRHACRAARSGRRAMKSSTSARPKNDCVRRGQVLGRDARNVLGADHRQVHAERRGSPTTSSANSRFCASSGLKSPREAAGDPVRQQAREFGHVQRPEQAREEHVLRDADRRPARRCADPRSSTRSGRRAKPARRLRIVRAQLRVGAPAGRLAPRSRPPAARARPRRRPRTRAAASCVEGATPSSTTVRTCAACRRRYSSAARVP